MPDARERPGDIISSIYAPRPHAGAPLHTARRAHTVVRRSVSEFSEEEIQFSDSRAAAVNAAPAGADALDAALADLQNRLDVLEGTIRSGVSTVTFDEAGNITSVNWADGIRQLLGYTDENDFPNTFDSWVRALPEDYRPRLTELFSDVAHLAESPDITHAQHPMVCKNGQVRWFDAVSKLVRRADGTLAALYATWRDITAEHDKDAQIEQMKVVGKIFDFCYFIRLADHSFINVKTNDRIQSVTAELSNDAFENLRAYAIQTISEQDQTATMAFLDAGTLQERLAQTGMETLEVYSPTMDDWYRLVFIGGHKDADGNYIDVIYGTSRITKDKLREQQYRRALDEQAAIVNALAKNYRNVYEANLDDGTARVIKLAEDYHVRAVRDANRQAFVFDDVVSRWLLENVNPDDRERMAAVFNMASLRKVFEEGDGSTGSYRSTDEGVEHTYQYEFRRVDGTHNIVVGFRIIDDVVEQQLELAREQREHIEVIQSLSTIYSTIFRADVDTHAYDILTSIPQMAKVAPTSGNFDDAKAMIIESFMAPEFRRQMDEFLDLNTLAARLADVNTVTADYIAVNGQWMQARFIVKRRDEDGVAKEVLYVARDISAEKATELAQQELMMIEQKRLETINAIGRVFSSMYLGYLDTFELEAVKDVGALKGGSAKIGPLSREQRGQILQGYVSEPYLEGQLAFTDLSTIAQRLEGQKYVSFVYQTVGGGWMQSMFVPQHYDANGNLDVVLLANRDVTEEKNRELAQQEALEGALAVAQQDKKDLLKVQSRLRDSMAVNDALSRDYSNVFLVRLKENLGKTVKEESYNVEGIDEYADTWFDYTYFIRKYIQVRVYGPDQQMMLEKTELNRVLGEIETNTDFSIPYRALVQGEVHHLQMRYVSVEGADLVAVGFRYVDDVVEAEAEQKKLLEEALAAAQQANRAKSTFLNSMSHDIRTPMNAIIGFTALAQTHIDDTALVQDYLGKISTSGTHLLSLINDILDMSRIESGTVKLEERPVHIPDLMRDLRTMVQGLVNAKNQHLFIDTQDVVHEDVVCDKLRLNQVLINIVGNANKFTPVGGDIIIRLAEKPCGIKDHTTLVFSVKDNGCGMSKKFLEHIFDTFTRERPVTVSGVQGTGLGMAITKNIVDMMGGTIDIQSEEGKGSTFTVTLDLRLAGEAVAYEPIPALLSARALVVDDDVDTCLSLSKMLREIQMRPDWTASGREAIVRAREAADSGDEYKVYIIDYLMPDMNGIETVRRIRRVISDDVPIIVLTAYDWGDLEAEAREAGVTAFVSKPIFMSELRQVLTRPAGAVDAGGGAATAGAGGGRRYDYGGRRVLLAEDNELNREIACAILEETGMVIDTVNDGDEAVAAVAEAPAGTYDLVLMDIQMPRMDGYTATREIRTLPDNEKANVPIVAMTANAFDEDRDKAFRAGMNGHIIKPISIDAIAAVLDEVFS